MSLSPSRLPVPPRKMMHRTTLTPTKPSSLIAKPIKGSLKMSGSQGRMVPFSLQIKQHTARSPSVGSSHSASLLHFSDLEFDKSSTHEIRIRVFSNYGNQSFISCSEIDIINEKKQTVPISSIRLEPKNNNSNNLLINSNKHRSLTKSSSASNLNIYDFSKLTNGSVMEKDESNYWHADWPPEFPMKYIDIVIIVKSSSPIDSLRIWPNKNDVSQNFKHVSIFLDQNLYVDKELENEFGLVIPLQKFDSEGNSRIIGSREPLCSVSDDFGILPVKAITSIEVIFLQSYQSNKYFGLQQIKFFDSHGDVIDLASKGLIECINCGNESEKNLKSVLSTEEPKLNFKWIGELNKDSKIVIKFFEAIIISAFSITTLQDCSEQIDISIKQLKVKFNNINVWCGMINRGDKRSDKTKERTDAIFLYDDLDVRDKIFKYLYHTNS